MSETEVRRTSAHMFIERDRLVLALQQAHGLRWWELPGGEVEAGETASAAAVREVFEETGVVVKPPELLRTWSYVSRDGRVTMAHEFAARSAAGDVVLSDEHAEYVWLSISEYAERYCGDPPEGAPAWIRAFLADMRENCAAFDAWLQN